MGRAALAAVCATSIALGFAVAGGFFWTYDSLAVLQGASAITKCVDVGMIAPCDQEIWRRSFYPLTQYIPALGLHALGAGGSIGLHALAWMSFAALVGIGGLFFAVSRDRALAALGVVALLASPLPVYADSAFGELLASFLIVLATAALITRQAPWVLAVLFAFAATTKESAPILLSLLAASVVIAQWASLDTPTRRRTVTAIAIGLVAGAALNAGFNLFRYGQPWNDVYAQNAGGINLEWWPGYALAALVSPNAGLLFAWPLGLALILAAVRRGPSAAPALLLGVIVVGFAVYFSPFGWYAWFNRYLIPWLPALILIAITVHREHVIAAIRPLARHALAYWSVAAVCAAFAVAQIGPIAAGQIRTFDWLFGRDAECPRALSRAGYDTPYTHRCQLHAAWEKKPVLMLGADAAVTEDRVPLALLAALACLSLAGVARRGLTR